MKIPEWLTSFGRRCCCSCVSHCSKPISNNGEKIKNAGVGVGMTLAGCRLLVIANAAWATCTNISNGEN